ncbi:MAG: hypothetical protein U9O64_04835 [Campylobacterota bacterium]|nr:hypothetical protein [Campylobacterota bacterium]
MKIIFMLLSSFLVGTSVQALSTKVEKPQLVQGSSVGEYRKPGAPVEIKYSSEHVNIVEVSKVDISLMSSLTEGTMDVKIKVDKELTELTNIDKKLSFELTNSDRTYPLYLEVSAESEGLYYIRVLVSIKGNGMRAFAIPVYVGSGILRKNSANVVKTKSGEELNLFLAEEIIVK